MTRLRSIQRSFQLAAMCAALAACTHAPPRQTDMDYRSTRAPTAQGAAAPQDGTQRRLTIQSGEGERLNLPWFIRDTQDWVNTQ